MRKIFFCISFGLLITNLNTYAQTDEPAAKFVTQFPFRQLSGGVMLIQARLNNMPDTLNFILDTGSGGISLDSATCEEFKIPHSPSGRTLNGIAGVRPVDFSQNNTLVLPGLKIYGLDFYINDYEILSNVYGEKVDGIIGYSFFSRYIIKFNFDSLYVQIFEPGTIQYPSGGYLLHPLFTSLPIEPLRIRDSRSVSDNFYFDTGAGLCFLLSKTFVEDSSFIMKRRKPVPIEAEGIGGRKRMLITLIKEVKLGPYRFRRVPTHILDDEFNATSYPFLGGLIGNDILRRFNTVLNYPSKEIHLIPNSHFNEPFDYSYTGMSIYLVDGKIIIDDLIKDSPADKAGFKKDDEIMAINNDFSNNITHYKNLLQSAGEKVKVLIMREKKPIIINFRIGRIF